MPFSLLSYSRLLPTSPRNELFVQQKVFSPHSRSTMGGVSGRKRRIPASSRLLGSHSLSHDLTLYAHLICAAFNLTVSAIQCFELVRFVSVNKKSHIFLSLPLFIYIS